MLSKSRFCFGLEEDSKIIKYKIERFYSIDFVESKWDIKIEKSKDSTQVILNRIY